MGPVIAEMEARGRGDAEQAHPVAVLRAEAAALATPDGVRRRRVLRGGPGTGKSAAVADVVRSALAAGVGLDQMLVLTHTAALGAGVLDRATADVDPTRVAGTGSPVRTVHSLAYGILRLAAARADAPPPRLLTGAEHDAMIRETLLGELADGARGWPERLRPALSTVGFARELRDLLLRSLERGLGPEDLAALGREAGREEWVAAAGFFRRHEQQMALRGGRPGAEAGTPEALNAAELVGAALDALAADPDLLAEVRDHRLVAVDDAHHLDPLSAELVTRVGGGADLLVVAEDPDQSVFRFRGAGGRLGRALADQGAVELDLLDGHRMPPAVAEVAAVVASRLPGAPRHRRGRAAGVRLTGSRRATPWAGPGDRAGSRARLTARRCRTPA